MDKERQTILLCYDCIPKRTYCYRIGGTLQNSPCQLCGKETQLGEYVLGKKGLDTCIKNAIAQVDSWPAWKQNILEQSMEPTVKTPRQPIRNR